jgi:hypothetical protein
VRLSRTILSVLFCRLLTSPTFGVNSIQVGQLWIVDTSVPDVLQSQSIQALPAITSVGKLQYEIGFTTGEQVDLGFLFDSMTIALAKADGSGAANLVTADAFGLTIEPLSPTGLLANGGITAQQTTLRISPLDNATMSFAYAIEVTLPPALVGQELQTTFSFFNNGDEVPTESYAALVPEPAPIALVGFAGVFGLIGILRKRFARI